MAFRTLVVQSHNETAARQGWLATCLDTVKQWSQRLGFDYAYIGDEALALAPAWYREKAGLKTPVIMDYARLVLMRDALEEGYERAIWFDADTLVFAPDRLTLDDHARHLFGIERWIEPDPRTRRLRVRTNVHNAALMFTRGDPVLPFLLHATESVVRRADPGRIAPQMVGPKLASALHNIAGFTLWPAAGAFSPPLLRDIAVGSGAALDLLKSRGQEPAAANLCLSLASETGRKTIEKAVSRLLERGRLP
jgi:hypothetical protein